MRILALTADYPSIGNNGTGPKLRRTRAMRVFAVDDDREILTLVRHALQISGFDRVTTACSGEEAIAMLDASRDDFDIFLLDIQMPGRDGVAVCQHIRTIERFADTPIIMLTAMSDRDYIERAFAVGATDYITKPFDLMELGTRLSVAAARTTEQVLQNVPATPADAPETKDETPEPPMFRLGDALEIHGVSRSIGNFAFENYVMAMSRASLLLSSVYAVKITDIDDMHAKLAAPDFRELLNVAANVISNASQEQGHLFSYRGNGVFLGLNWNGRKLKMVAFDQRLAEAAHAAGGYLASLGLQPLDMVLGDSVPLATLRKRNALYAFRKAIEAVEQKAEQLNHQRGRGPGASASEAQRHDYEALLRNYLSDSESASPGH